LFDKPVEGVVSWVFHKGFETIGGPSAVEGRKPMPGLRQLIKPEKEKEKEL
jgi:fission process protein 1